MELADFHLLAPLLPPQALALHNQIIRKCCHEYAGCVLQLEGDAFVIAFHEPLDAVAFALQVGVAQRVCYGRLLHFLWLFHMRKQWLCCSGWLHMGDQSTHGISLLLLGGTGVP